MVLAHMKHWTMGPNLHPVGSAQAMPRELATALTYVRKLGISSDTGLPGMSRVLGVWSRGSLRIVTSGAAPIVYLGWSACDE